MTILARRIAAQIATGGPLTLAEFMSQCLTDPVHGYYVTRDPLGRAGDFTTSPEISQMFGELVGLWLAQAWLDRGRPAPFILAELGPGRGTLMADILRAICVVPGMLQAARVNLVEVSPALRRRQAQVLSSYNPTWHDSTDQIPAGPLFLVANEFLDALPIRQFVRGRLGWAERQVGLREGRLVFGLSPELPVAALDHRLADTGPGDIVEISPALPAVAAGIARRIAEHGGAALFIDYGGWRSLGDTFQAVRDHAPADPLTTAGAADLTAHVDFEAIARAVHSAGAAATPMVPQGRFLLRLGIKSRAERLARGLSGTALDLHNAALRRLTHPEEMGNLFKVMGCHAVGSPDLPGLDP